MSQANRYDRGGRREPDLARELAYTLVELLISLALMGILLALTVPQFTSMVKDRQSDRAILDLELIDFEIRQYTNQNGVTPDSLADIGMDDLRDPWGNTYYYQPHRGPGWRGRARKDRFLVPLNSDYDLYSAGPDGETRRPLANPHSHDDIIRASDGAYFGVASEF